MRQMEMFIGDYNPRLNTLAWAGLCIKGSLKGAPETSSHVLIIGLLDRAGTGGKGEKRPKILKPIIILSPFESIYGSNCLQCYLSFS